MPATPTVWYAGPWIWDTSIAGRPHWRPPAGLNGLDLRNLGDQAVAGGTPGLGVFFGPVLPANLENRADYKPLGSGSWYDIQPNAVQIAAIPRRKGFTPTGTDLVGILLSILTDGASPDGSDGPLPIMPTVEGRVELHTAQSHHENFRWGGGHTGVLRQVIRADFARIWAATQGSPIQKVREFPLRRLDDWMKKFAVADWKEFVPVALQPSVPGPLPRETTITEDFTHADSTSVMGHLLTWTQVSGTWGTFSNFGYKSASGGTNQSARAESDLSSADHYAQVIAGADGTPIVSAFAGPACRFAGGAQTFYLTANFSDQQYITKCVAGTDTNLVNAAHTYTDELLKIEANGSTLKSYAAGVLISTTTDSSITGNTRTGLRSFETNETFASFQAADLGGGGGIIYTQLERGIRGFERGVFSGGSL